MNLSQNPWVETLTSASGAYISTIADTDFCHKCRSFDLGDESNYAELLKQ